MADFLLFVDFCTAAWRQIAEEYIARPAQKPQNIFCHTMKEISTDGVQNTPSTKRFIDINKKYSVVSHKYLGKCEGKSKCLIE